MAEVTCECVIDRELYEYNAKKYINLELDEYAVEIVKTVQKAPVDFNPLVGNVLKVKVPYRYRKLECKVGGGAGKTLYDFTEGVKALVCIKCCGVWSAEGVTGYAWKLVTIS